MLSSLLLIIVLKALSREVRLEYLELLYADNLTLVIETLEGLKRTLEAWKGTLESKGLKVCVMNMKGMISSENTGKVSKEGKFCCAVSSKGVGSNTSSVSFTDVGCIRDVVVLEVK